MKYIVPIIMLLFLSSCFKDYCNSTSCGPHYQCVFGNCTCASEYEGVNCSTAKLKKFVGTYSGSLTINDTITNPQTFYLVINSDSSHLYLNTNSISYYSAIQFVPDTGSLNITTASFDIVDSAGLPLYGVSGYGRLSNNLDTLKLTYYYSYSSTGTGPSHRFIGTRQ